MKILKNSPYLVVGFEYKPKLWKDASIISLIVTIGYSILFFNNFVFIHYALGPFKEAWIQDDSLYIFVDLIYLIFYFLVGVWVFESTVEKLDFPKIGSKNYPSALFVFFLKIAFFALLNEYITIIFIAFGALLFFVIVFALSIQFLLSWKIIFAISGLIFSLGTTAYLFGIQNNENTIIVIFTLSVFFTVINFILFKLLYQLKPLIFPAQQTLYKTCHIKEKILAIAINRNNIFIGTKSGKILVYSLFDNKVIAVLKGHRETIKKLIIKNNILLSLDSFSNLGVWSAIQPFHFIQSEVNFPFEGESENLQEYLQVTKFYNKEFQKNLDAGLSSSKAYKTTISNNIFDQKVFTHHSHEYYSAEVKDFTFTNEYIILNRGYDQTLEIFDLTFQKIDSLKMSGLSREKEQKNEFLKIKNTSTDSTQTQKKEYSLIDLAVSQEFVCLLLGESLLIDGWLTPNGPFKIELYTIINSELKFYKEIKLDTSETVGGIIVFTQERIIYHTSKQIFLVNNYQTNENINEISINMDNRTYLPTKMHHFQFPYLIVAEIDHNSEKSYIKIYNITDKTIENTLDLGKKKLESVFFEENIFLIKLEGEDLKNYFGLLINK